MKRTGLQFMASVFVLLASLSMVAAPLVAHHGRGAVYDDSKILVIEGEVSEWAWRNPHVALYVDVKAADGSVINWAFESQNVGSLSRLGMSRQTFVPGQQITVRFNPSRGGAPVGVIRRVDNTATGEEILAWGGPIDD